MTAFIKGYNSVLVKPLELLKLFLPLENGISSFLCLTDAVAFSLNACNESLWAYSVAI